MKLLDSSGHSFSSVSLYTRFQVSYRFNKDCLSISVTMLLFRHNCQNRTSVFCSDCVYHQIQTPVTLRGKISGTSPFLAATCQFYLLVVTCQKKTCQLHKVATSLLKSGLLQLVIYRLVTNIFKLVTSLCG